MEKYGFVHIWMDRKYPRFYIGSHWGSETDGYVCSSNWMYNTHKRRPQDFKRRILARGITSKQDLLIEEGKWLALIPKEEIGKRYYNLHNAQPGHWTALDSTLSIRDKISKSVQGYMWYTDGVTSIQLRAGDEVPEGFVRGRAPDMSDESRRRRKEAAKSRPPATEGTRNKISESNKGRVPKNLDALQKAGSDATRGKPWSQARREAEARCTKKKGKVPANIEMLWNWRERRREAQLRET